MSRDNGANAPERQVLTSSEYRRMAEEARAIALDFWHWGMPGCWLLAKVLARLHDFQAWMISKGGQANG